MKQIFVLAISCVFLLSCASNSEKEKENSTQEMATEEGHTHGESSEAIELNNGEKWTVNEEMKPFVLKGEELVNGYVQNNQTDYQALATQLKDQDDQLISSCTMDGKSHDELHKWLHPHLELVEQLEKSSDAENAKTTVAALQSSFQTYHQYFN